MRRYITILLIILPSVCLAGQQIIFQEDFENAPLNQPYPWNGSNNDNWYDWAYNRAVPITNFPEHDRNFLGDNILYINAGESYQLIPSQTLTVKIEYDLLFHYSEESPSGFGALFSQSIIVNSPEPRGGIIHLHIQKGYDYSFAQEDGIYWSENPGGSWYGIGDIIPDTWYHIERTLYPIEQIENVRITNRDVFQEFNFSYNIITPINSIEGFSLSAHYSPSYSLIDNLTVETVPEPGTIVLFILGALGLARKNR